MVRPTLREALSQSHVAGVGIAALLLWSLDTGIRGLWYPLPPAAEFLATAIAIRGIPSYLSPFADRLALLTTSFYLFIAVVFFLAAWVLARWVYKQTPLRVLGSFRNKLAGVN